MSSFNVMLTPTPRPCSRNGPGWRVAAAEAQLRLPSEDVRLAWAAARTRAFVLSSVRCAGAGRLRRLQLRMGSRAVRSCVKHGLRAGYRLDAHRFARPHAPLTLPQVARFGCGNRGRARPGRVCGVRGAFTPSQHPLATLQLIPHPVSPLARAGWTWRRAPTQRRRPTSRCAWQVQACAYLQHRARGRHGVGCRLKPVPELGGAWSPLPLQDLQPPS